jgi:hypothetical protein
MANDLGTQLLKNEVQIATRRTMGDTLDTPREIDHNAYFRRKSVAQAAADDLIRLGYRATVGGIILRWTLEAHRIEPLDSDNPARFVTEVYGIVAAHGGSYDGWGGTVCP